MGREEERNGPTPGESRILDEPRGVEIEQLANVIEAYPDIRFITELRFDDKPHLTMISALPAVGQDPTTPSRACRAVSFLPTRRPKLSCKNRSPKNCWARLQPRRSTNQCRGTGKAAAGQRIDDALRATDARAGSRPKLRPIGKATIATFGRRRSLFRCFARAEAENRRRRRSRS